MRRVLLTGGLTVFAFGGASQAAMGLLLSLLSYKVYAHYAPFIEDGDDAVSEVAQTELVLVFFSALMLVVAHNTDGESALAKRLFAGMLLLTLAAGVGVVLWLVGAEFVVKEARAALAGRAAAAEGGGDADALDVVAAVEDVEPVLDLAAVDAAPPPPPPPAVVDRFSLSDWPCPAEDVDRARAPSSALSCCALSSDAAACAAPDAAVPDGLVDAARARASLTLTRTTTTTTTTTETATIGA